LRPKKARPNPLRARRGRPSRKICESQPQFKFAIAGGKAKQPKTAAAPATKAKSKRKSA
jgi:hypothetical protein